MMPYHPLRVVMTLTISIIVFGFLLAPYNQRAQAESALLSGTFAPDGILTNLDGSVNPVVHPYKPETSVMTIKTGDITKNDCTEPLLGTLEKPTEKPTLVSSNPTGKGKLQAILPLLPLSFEVNQGQTAKAEFLARGRYFNLILSSTEASLKLHGFAVSETASTAEHSGGHNVSIRLVGANPTVRGIGEQMLPGQVNYFLGNNPTDWHTGVPTFKKVRYREVYPGIDLIYYGREGQLEYDFLIAPGADPGNIVFRIDGADDLSIDPETGDAVLSTSRGEFRLQKPTIYQDAEKQRKKITGGYVLENSRLAFKVGSYDAAKPLVIDPVVLFSTLFGSSFQDFATDVALDADGYIYFSGRVDSSLGQSDLPVQDPIQPTHNGGRLDAYVAKIDPKGPILLFSTYLGGTGSDAAYGIDVDGTGNAYIIGVTQSTDFPLVNPIQSVPLGDDEVFVAKLSTTGSGLLFSTYLGGSERDDVDELGGGSIRVGSDGSIFVTGGTRSADFPMKNPLQGVIAGDYDMFVTRIDPMTPELIFSTFLGGGKLDFASGLDLDPAGNIYITGFTGSDDIPVTPAAFQTTNAGKKDAYLAKLTSDGSSLIFASYLGGSFDDSASDIAVDFSGNAHLVGITVSRDFPVVNPVQPLSGGEDAFVAKFTPSGSGVFYSTYFGGRVGSTFPSDIGTDIAVDFHGNTYITGRTNTIDFPTAYPVQAEFAADFSCPACASVGHDAFVAKFSRTGWAVLFSTYFGGQSIFLDIGRGIAVDFDGVIHFVGGSDSPFPVENPLPTAGFLNDGFVTMIGGFPDSVDLQVPVDFKPGFCPNTLPVNFDGTLPVAIIDSNTFDVTKVDIPTVRLEGIQLNSGFLQDVGRPFKPYIGKVDCEDCAAERPDQMPDLVYEVDVQALVNAVSPISPGDCVTVQLTGALLDATPIVGEEVLLATQAVPLDVRPEGCPNIINTKSKGNLKVAIVGTNDFDPTQVDTTTVQLEGVSPVKISFEDVSTPFEPFVQKSDCFACNVVGGDGIVDLVMKFDNQELVASLAPFSGNDCRTARLRANLLDGTPIEGEDRVIILDH